ncbi:MULTISPECIES: membrane protein [Rhizobium/Agrobacterium group]|uniref:Transmembrane protein n=2 Tax=Neorhizobium TaxID=1525371 RepID=A0ABV0LXL6_9HYPH|nr:MULTISPECIES: membrane protein [Rhizobium/Agrobacterium group]KGD99849.1 membrane protein [Rhizobium sp. YS-1r]MCC2611376.1 hypothetical protein [Neorhizobium petrolearium]WGI66570.1 hypothetical protein QEO92_16235 [Neorhizobium petrolearium]
MRTIVAIAGLVLALAGCTVDSVGRPSPALEIGPGIEPIPGSITYGGQPRTRLTKSPIGSVVSHQFRNEFGQRVEERYILQPDRSLKLVSRRVYREPFWDD